jgi:hypothetical protein
MLIFSYIFSSALLMFVPYVTIIIGLTVTYEKIMELINFLLIKSNISYIPSLLCEEFGKKTLRNILDQPFVPWIIHLSYFTPCLFFISFYIQTYCSFSLNSKLLFMLLYHVLLIGPRFRNFTLCNVILHKNSHTINGIFKYKFMNLLFEWFIGIFYGIRPEHYSVCHVKDHHKYNGRDLICSTQFDRTSFWDFLIYLSIYGASWMGFSHVIDFYNKKKYIFAIRTALGCVFYFGFFLILYKINSFFALTHYLLIHIFNIIFLSAVNWTWHGFCDKDQIDNEYINSTTIINGTDNVFNEDYHVAHHLQHTMHWINLKTHYEENIEVFKNNQATIFTDIQQIELFFYMILKKYDLMAKKFVDLSGKLTHEDKVKLLKKRMEKIIYLEKEN